MRAKDATLNVVSVSENSPIHEVVRLAPVEIRVSAVQSSTDHDLFVASLFGHIAATVPAVSDLLVKVSEFSRLFGAGEMYVACSHVGHRNCS